MDWSDSHHREIGEKLFEVVCTCPKKTNKCVSEEVNQITWSPIKRGRGRPKQTLDDLENEIY